MRIRARWERSQSCRRAAIRILITGDDPDAGVWSYGYDAMGSQTSVTDARGTTTYTVYDELGRPRELRRDGPTGPVLATWSYDAAGEKGLLDRAHG